MELTAAFRGELAFLTATLDHDDVDIVAGLGEVAGSADAAVSSYLGLGVIATRTDPPFELTVLTPGAAALDVVTSLALSFSRPGPMQAPLVSLVLFAGTPGAFVDLAADLAWLTHDEQVDIVLDAHVGLGQRGTTESTVQQALRSASAINQALGALIGRGHTPEEASRELEALAARDGVGHDVAAERFLVTLGSGAASPVDSDDADTVPGP